MIMLNNKLIQKISVLSGLYSQLQVYSLNGHENILKINKENFMIELLKPLEYAPFCAWISYPYAITGLAEKKKYFQITCVLDKNQI